MKKKFYDPIPILSPSYSFRQKIILSFLGFFPTIHFFVKKGVKKTVMICVCMYVYVLVRKYSMKDFGMVFIFKFFGFFNIFGLFWKKQRTYIHTYTYTILRVKKCTA